MNNKKSIFTNTVFVALSALLCCALWGSATPFIKTGYELLLPVRNVPSIILFAGIRFTLAGILTVLIYSIARKKFLYPQKKNLGKVALVAAFQTVIQYIFFYVGLANTSGVKGTVITGANAFCTILVASLIFRTEKLTAKKVIACILGFAGIVVINLKGLDLNLNFLGDCFCFFSSVSYAFSSVMIKLFSKDEDPVVISGYQFILGGIFLILTGLIFGGNVQCTSISGAGVLFYLSCLSAVAYALWGVLLKHNPVSKVSIFSFTTPVFGTILSMLMLTESANVNFVNLLITLTLVSSGIIILNYSKTKN